jgi:hypothetical protein
MTKKATRAGSSRSPYAVAGLVALAAVTASCIGAADPGEAARSARAPSSRQEARASEARTTSCASLRRAAKRLRRGYVPRLSPDVLVIPRPPNYIGAPTDPPHNAPRSELTNVPLLLYGPGFVRSRGEISGRASMADVAPTIAELVGFEEAPETRGDALGAALVRNPPGRRPALVVTLVWDGGGWNVLRRHRGSWPFLRSLLRRGSSYPRMDVGSAPTMTAPIHTTLGTGVFPRRHGIAALNVRIGYGEYMDPMLFADPSAIRVPTLADVYDRRRGNRPLIGLLGSSSWHLGMIGHGASFPGGDFDTVVLVDEFGATRTNHELYSLPAIGDTARRARLEQRLDASDGELDESWEGESLEHIQARNGNPSAVRYEQWLLERLIAAEGFGEDDVPDLLFVNFKAADEAGHRWGMGSNRVARVLTSLDRALRDLVRALNRDVGNGRWVLALTADHGQMPSPEDTGGWAIRGAELALDANRRFDRNDNGIDLVDKVVSAGLYVTGTELRANDVDLRDIADWTLRYTSHDNLTRPTVPPYWEGDLEERLFSGALVRRRVADLDCEP